MTADELAEIGERLFGEQWQSPLARVLGTDARRVRAWLSGTTAILPYTAFGLLLLHEFGRDHDGTVHLRPTEEGHLILARRRGAGTISVSGVPRAVTAARVLEMAIHAGIASTTSYDALGR